MGSKQHLCAKFHRAVELIGGRWTGAVIRLLLNERMRFAELRAAIPDISDRMLSERLRELEAEATAMLVCAALGLPGLEEARGYIQHWVGVGANVPECSARRIFKAADAILRAGREGTPHESTPDSL